MAWRGMAWHDGMKIPSFITVSQPTYVSSITTYNVVVVVPLGWMWMIGDDEGDGLTRTREKAESDEGDMLERRL